MNPIVGSAGSQRGRTQAMPASRCARGPLARGILFLLGWLALCGIALANEGRLILVSGEVTLQRTVPGQPARRLVPENGTVVTAGDAILTGADGRVQIAFSDGSLLSLQPRFHRREGRRALGFLAHPRFRAAYDFLLLRAEAGAEDPKVAEWWTEIQALSPEQQRERVGHGGGGGADEQGPPRRRRRRRGGRRHRAPPAET